MAEKPTQKKPQLSRSKKQPPRKTFKEQFVEFGKSIGFALVAVIILNSFVLASFQVPTGSMEMTVLAGDLLFVNKFIYGGTTPPTVPILGILTGKEIEIPYFRIPGFREPRQSDVIVFIFPGYRDDVKAREFQYYLKRCVAVSGDTLEVREKQVYVNGKIFPNPPGVHYLTEPRQRGSVNTDIFPKNMPWNQDNYGPLRIPKKGDVVQLTMENLEQWNTFIKREGHTVEVSDGKILVDGKQVQSYTVERDYVFGMGDNRDDSLDSRFWGFIPKEHVVGTPMIVYWSWDPNVQLFNLFKKLSTIRLNRIATIIY